MYAFYASVFCLCCLVGIWIGWIGWMGTWDVNVEKNSLFALIIPGFKSKSKSKSESKWKSKSIFHSVFPPCSLCMKLDLLMLDAQCINKYIQNGEWNCLCTQIDAFFLLLPWSGLVWSGLGIFLLCLTGRDLNGLISHSIQFCILYVHTTKTERERKRNSRDLISIQPITPTI